MQKPQPNEKPQSPINSLKPVDSLYFDGYHDISLPIDSSLDTLVSSLLKDIKTNQNVSINYANVNLSSIGTYSVYYYVGNQTYTISVTIY